MSEARTIMIQGTASHVGKSLVATALCRIFYRRGLRTAPFKAQNMALNSAVTIEGGEIGRAQAVQAEAAGVEARVIMNPILLKPNDDMCSQVVVMGRPLQTMCARQYRDEFLPGAVDLVRDCLEELRSFYEIIVIEGAGSPAEINLKDRDIVNMKTAELADAPVILVADIDRGGVFASIIGTMELLEPHEKARVAGIVINKFRGDLGLLQGGLSFIEERCGVPVLGVLPYIRESLIDEEDSVSLSDQNIWGDPEGQVEIALLQLPRISNYTDINSLKSLPDTRIRLVRPGDSIGRPDLLIIPGTKNTIADLFYLREEGYEKEIQELARTGGMVAGICGGYQMMGMSLHDPEGVEGAVRDTEGMGLLPVMTTFSGSKRTCLTRGNLCAQTGFWKHLQEREVGGYEIHCGQSILLPGCEPLMSYDDSRQGQVVDGAAAFEGRVFGAHLHGIFDNQPLLRLVINTLRRDKDLPPLDFDVLAPSKRQQNFEKLADIVEQSLDMKRILQIMKMTPGD